MSNQRSKWYFTGVLAASIALAGCATKRPAQRAAPPFSESSDYHSPQAEIQPPPNGVGALQAQLAAIAGDRVFFDVDQHSLSEVSRATLQRQADWFAIHSNLKIRVEGNCDERGTREYNLALGARRAASVRDYLIARGVAPQRISTISYGKERRLEVGSDEQSWARNRNAFSVLVEPGTF